MIIIIIIITIIISMADILSVITCFKKNIHDVKRIFFFFRKYLVNN